MIDFEIITDMQWLNLWSHIWTLRKFATFQMDFIEDYPSPTEWETYMRWHKVHSPLA